MKKRIPILLIFLLVSVASACAQSTPVPTAISLPTGTLAPTETPLPTLTSTPTEVPREPTGPQAGTTLFYHDGSTLVYIPAGEFEMGGDGKNNPLHHVSLRGYWLQRTEVTRIMFANCLAAGECPDFIDNKMKGKPADSAYSNRPVVGVSYEQAQSYCAWIGGRMPTEAEWEYAARGTSGNIYPWGNDEPTCDSANFNNCVGEAARVTDHQLDKSPFGILGMAGNVREWVSDYYDGNYYKNSPSQNPTGPQKGNYYVVRGGAYASPPEEVKSFYRGFIKVAGTERDLGFRCIVENPGIYAPYCESPSFTQETQTNQPADRCIPDISLKAGTKCGTINGTVADGELISVYPTTIFHFECAITDPSNLLCTTQELNHWPIVSIAACVRCTEPVTTSTPALECPINYQSTEDGSHCEYAAGPWVDYCLPNSIPLNENQCVYQQVQAGSCPLGSYFDEGMKACVTVGQTLRECKDGFNYDFERSCCKESVTVKYPSCLKDEYYSSEYGCVPLPLPGGMESCSSSAIKTMFCQ